MYSWQCYTPFLATQALGRGSSTHGCAASEADGGRFAMGNTEEKRIVSVLGVRERGCKDDGAFVRVGERAGTGRLGPRHPQPPVRRRASPRQPRLPPRRRVDGRRLALA